LENGGIMTAKKKILIMGPICNISGYSEHARMFADAFLEDNNFETYLIDLQWANTTRSRTYEKKYAECITKSQVYLRYLQSTNISMNDGFDCCYQVRPPNEFQQVTDYDIGVTAALETTAAPAEWIDKCNAMQKILVVSEHAKKNLENAVGENGEKITTPVSVIPFYNNLPATSDREKFVGYEDITTDTNFLCVSQIAPRKNLHEMISNFVQEFKDDPNVGLVLKSYIQNNSNIDRNETTNNIKTFINSVSKDKKCKVYLLHGNMSEAEISSLYDKDVIKGYISTTHGEGFGIPIFNAACSDIPVIATSWSGHLDFLSAPVTNDVSKKTKTKNLFIKVPYLIDKVKKHHLMPGLINEGAKWAYPDMKTFRKRLRELAESRRIYKKDAETLGEHIRNTFTKENIFQKIVDSSNDVTKTSEIDTDDLDKKSLQAIHHTTVMMNLGNQIKNISEKQK
jgi:glycosyltransferase involved in cell wall biosynthesis